jgi:putative ABC transport system permease protein
METATLLADGGPAGNTILANAPDPGALSARLEPSGWFAYPAAVSAQNNSSAQDLFETLLKGAGVLGMLVGGIGIANTMQVLLHRRQREVAIWKALGYQDVELQALFAMEAFLLGSIGSLLGLLLGLGISMGLVDLFTRTSNLLISWTFSPYPLVLSGIVGILTTIIFAIWAIAGAAQVQPLALLRNEPVRGQGLPKAKKLGLAIVLAVPFTAITSLVMGSLLKGVGVLLFALLGLAILGGGLGGLVWLAARLLPLRRLPLARMAQTNLRRRGLSLVFAMIALFCGVVSIALGVVVTENANSTLQDHMLDVHGYNLHVVAPFDEQAAVRQAVSTQPLQAVAYSYQTQLLDILVEGGESSHTPVLLGYSELPENYQVNGATWGSQAQGVYTYIHAQIPAGSQVEVVFRDGSQHMLEVVGVYDYIWGMSYRQPVLGLLAPAGLSFELAEPDSVTYYLQTSAGEAKKVSAALGKALPRATVVNIESYLARYVQVYRNLFVLAIAMAGLALLAGALLVANSVSLAMLDRRYEIGILKAVGYSQFHILASLAVEYSLAALIATAAGLAAVKILIILLTILNDLADDLLVLSAPACGLVLLVGLGLVLATVLWVTWGPTRVSPAVLLTEQT